MESVRLKDGRYIDTDGVYDFEQKKTQKEINASLVQADNLKSGYFVLPGGLKMCWGTAEFSENEKIISFPIIFSSAPKVFTNCQTSQSSNGGYIVTSCVVTGVTDSSQIIPHVFIERNSNKLYINAYRAINSVIQNNAVTARVCMVKIEYAKPIS